MSIILRQMGAIVLIVLRTIFVFFEARDCCIE